MWGGVIGVTVGGGDAVCYEGMFGGVNGGRTYPVVGAYVVDLDPLGMDLELKPEPIIAFYEDGIIESASQGKL